MKKKDVLRIAKNAKKHNFFSLGCPNVQGRILIFPRISYGIRQNLGSRDNTLFSHFGPPGDLKEFKGHPWT